MRNLGWRKILVFLGVQLKIKGMIIRAITIMAAVFLLTGCGKKPETSSTTTKTAVQPTNAQKATTAPVQNPPTAPVQNSQTPAPGTQMGGAPKPYTIVAPPGQTVSGPPNLKMMSTAVRVWIGMHQAVPMNFEQWAATPNIAYPPPPPGKKYALDKKLHVVLVNR
jgi:type IV secretory pathway VirB10-like protein